MRTRRRGGGDRGRLHSRAAVQRSVVGYNRGPSTSARPDTSPDVGPSWLCGGTGHVRRNGSRPPWAKACVRTVHAYLGNLALEQAMSSRGVQIMNGIDPSAVPSGTGCVECEAAGGCWVHLPRCTKCGHIGCCDSSPEQPAGQHAARTGHPFVQSFEPETRGSGTTRPGVTATAPGSPTLSSGRSTSRFRGGQIACRRIGPTGCGESAVRLVVAGRK
jgi:Zn-finger in ubiquitin-hydrolases and other protein